MVAELYRVREETGEVFEGDLDALKARFGWGYIRLADIRNGTSAGGRYRFRRRGINYTVTPAQVPPFDQPPKGFGRADWLYVHWLIQQRDFDIDDALAYATGGRWGGGHDIRP